MGFRLVFLTSDILFFLSLFLIMFFVWKSQKKQLVHKAYVLLFNRPIATISFVIILLYLSLAIIDSIHFQIVLKESTHSDVKQYTTKVYSVLDLVMSKRSSEYEKTYSAPFALHQYVKENRAEGGQYYPRLIYIPKNITSNSERTHIILVTIVKAIMLSMSLAVITVILMFLYKTNCLGHNIRFAKSFSRFYFIFGFLLLSLVMALYSLSNEFHVLGTGKVGQDIFYFTLKSVRTGLFIGLLTTMVMLPFALCLGISAGYFGKRIDDIIQYLYITISSIPGVLLIAASVLSMQVFIVNHPGFFNTLTERADARLITLCCILGMTSWTGLCRMLRAETMKIKEIDYIHAARALGSSHSYIIFKHILPNVMHLILIAVVLDFSFLVLAEAVLSYIGVGVSPLTISWGNMINGARLELAREPIVWWPIFAAFIFMFNLVLAVNLFADALRDVFDPRTH